MTVGSARLATHEQVIRTAAEHPLPMSILGGDLRPQPASEAFNWISAILACSFVANPPEWSTRIFYDIFKKRMFDMLTFSAVLTVNPCL